MVPSPGGEQVARNKQCRVCELHTVKGTVRFCRFFFQKVETSNLQVCTKLTKLALWVSVEVHENRMQEATIIMVATSYNSTRIVAARFLRVGKLQVMLHLALPRAIAMRQTGLCCSAWEYGRYTISAH